VLGSGTGFAVQMSSAGRRLGSAFYQNLSQPASPTGDHGIVAPLLLARGSTSISDGESPFGLPTIHPELSWLMQRRTTG
jgi:hypothetical protein